VAERLVIALGGNAIAREGHADPESQREAVEGAMGHVARLIEAGHEVAVTHGNGPQVGNLLLKNELASDVVPPVPLDWCVAQTQATLGYLISTSLERSLRRLGIERTIAVVVTRVLVDADDPGFESPTKPIGADHRLVPSPEPRRIIDEPTIALLLDDGAVVVAAGGGGIPMVRDNGGLLGVEAVVDKDLCAALLAQISGADALVIATDVPGVCLGVDGDREGDRWIGEIGAPELRRLADSGAFPAGSMGPKVEACLRFVEEGGDRAVICSLDHLGEASSGRAGTVIRGGRL
jgi:carbamate kinase